MAEPFSAQHLAPAVLGRSRWMPWKPRAGSDLPVEHALLRTVPFTEAVPSSEVLCRRAPRRWRLEDGPPSAGGSPRWLVPRALGVVSTPAPGLFLHRSGRVLPAGGRGLRRRRFICEAGHRFVIHHARYQRRAPQREQSFWASPRQLSPPRRSAGQGSLPPEARAPARSPAGGDLARRGRGSQTSGHRMP